MYEHIQVAEADGIMTITLNRPDKLNAFIGHMRRDLAEALEHAGSDRGTRVVIITGAARDPRDSPNDEACDRRDQRAGVRRRM